MEIDDSSRGHHNEEEEVSLSMDDDVASMNMGEGDEEKGHRARRRRRRKKERANDDQQDTPGPITSPPSTFSLSTTTSGLMERSQPGNTISRNGNGTKVISQEGGMVVTMESLPDVALLRIVEMLSTPPPLDPLEPTLRPLIIRNLASMARLSHRWKRVVRSSDVWRAVYERSWPWSLVEGGDEVMEELSSKDPTDRCLKTDGNVPWWTDLCYQMGRCLREACLNQFFFEDYIMTVKMCNGETRRCFLLETGSLSLLPGYNASQLILSTVNRKRRCWPQPVTDQALVPIQLYMPPTVSSVEVQVLLINKWNKKKAILYFARQSLQPNGQVLHFPWPREVMVPGYSDAVSFQAEIRATPFDLDFSLKVGVPIGVGWEAINRVFRSLPWV